MNKNSIKLQIHCTSLAEFRAVCKKLSGQKLLGPGGQELDTYGMTEYHFGLGIRYINVYNGNTVRVKYAHDSKGIAKDLIMSASDFIK